MSAKIDQYINISYWGIKNTFVFSTKLMNLYLVQLSSLSHLIFCQDITIFSKNILVVRILVKS